MAIVKASNARLVQPFKESDLVVFCNGLREGIDSFRPDAAKCGKLAKYVTAALDAGTTCVDLLAGTSDEAERRLTRAMPTFNSAAQRVAQGTPGRVIDQQEAADALVADEQNKLLDQVADKAAEASVDAATRWAAALAKLERKTNAMESLATAPAAFRTPQPKVIDLMMLEDLRLELRSRGIFYLTGQYDRAQAEGDDDAMRKIERAARPFLYELARDAASAAREASLRSSQEIEQVQKNSPLAKLPSNREISSLPDGATQAVMMGAMDLLGRFERADRSRVPPEVGLAKMILAQLEDIFRSVVGFSPRGMGPNERESRYYRTGGFGQFMHERFEVRERWPVFYLRPQNADGLRRQVSRFFVKRSES